MHSPMHLLGTFDGHEKDVYHRFSKLPRKRCMEVSPVDFSARVEAAMPTLLKLQAHASCHLSTPLLHRARPLNRKRNRINSQKGSQHQVRPLTTLQRRCLFDAKLAEQHLSKAKQVRGLSVSLTTPRGFAQREIMEVKIAHEHMNTHLR